jgi:hypothetical protein
MLQEMAQWSCPLPGGGAVQEWALTHRPDGDEKARLLIVPALFDEGNKMRRFTVEVMRRLSASGIACVLPDLPGLNESGLPLEEPTPSDWQAAMEGAARHFGATHMLAIRGGALAAPRDVPGWHYAPSPGPASCARCSAPASSPRAKRAAGEAGQPARTRPGQGLELAGYRLGPDFLSEFGGIVADARPDVQTITQDMLGGPGLWLRPEPGEDACRPMLWPL